MGGPEMGGAGGGAPAAAAAGPCGVNPANDLKNATKSADMGDVFLKLQAYDLALAAYRDAAKFEPESKARAQQGIAKATALLNSSRVIRARMAGLPRAQASSGGGPGALPGMPGMGGPGGMGMAPGMEGGMMGSPGPGMPGMGGPPGLPGGMSAGSGYQISGPAVPPTSLGF